MCLPKICLFHRVPYITGDVLFSTKESSPYDLALVRLRESIPEAVVPQMAQSFNPGLISLLFSGEPHMKGNLLCLFLHK